MPSSISRRDVLVMASGLGSAIVLGDARATATPPPVAEPVHERFPAQAPALVQEMVGVSHGGFSRVQALLAERPALANAAWDWGFGDWETALGAASHMGRRDIADVLIAAGARPDIFTFAMLGRLDVVRAYVESQPGVQGTKGPHGLTLLHHARQGGDEAAGVVAYLQEVGGADEPYATVPLTEAQANLLTGQYQRDDSAADVIEIGMARDGGLTVKRLPDGTARPLFHLGDLEFHPAGAPAVRLRIVSSPGGPALLTIMDGPSVLTARQLATRQPAD